MGVVAHILKIDIDSAFRGVSIMPEHRWAAYVGFIHRGCTYVAGHLAIWGRPVAFLHGIVLGVP